MEATLVSLTPIELRRLAVVERVVAGDLTQVAGAPLLGLSLRQFKRLVAGFRRDGPRALSSKRRGRPSNRRVDPALVERARSLYRQHYGDFGPTFAAEKLAQRHDIVLDHETLRRALIASGDHKARRRKERKPHLPRERRAARGELVQLDGSLHAWFEQRGPRCTLLVAIDDATSDLLALRFEPTETASGYFALLRPYLEQTGRPLSFYTDKSGIFRKTVESATEEKTQFGRALDELDIELICANSPQAKGRVERVNATLQDRLVKELRLRKIASIDVGNIYLPEYIAEHNRNFGRIARTTFDAHRALGTEHNLAHILTLRHRRTIGVNGIISYDGRLFAVDHQQARSLTSRVVEIRVDGERIVIAQGQTMLRFTALPIPVKPTRPAVVERVDLRVPNPKKAHTPAPNHPWRTPTQILAQR